VSRYQKCKTNLDFTEARDSERQWHQLGHMQVCTSLQTDNHANTSPLKFFIGQMPFLPPNQQRQSTEGRDQQCTANKQWCIEGSSPSIPYTIDSSSLGDYCRLGHDATNTTQQGR